MGTRILAQTIPVSRGFGQVRHGQLTHSIQTKKTLVVETHLVYRAWHFNRVRSGYKGWFSHESSPQRPTKWAPELISRFETQWDAPTPFPIITLTCLKSIPLIIKCTSYKRVARLIDRIPRSQPSTTVGSHRASLNKKPFYLFTKSAQKLGWAGRGLWMFHYLRTTFNHWEPCCGISSLHMHGTSDKCH